MDYSFADGGCNFADMDGGVIMNNHTDHTGCGCPSHGQAKGKALSQWLCLRFLSLLLIPLTVWLVISIVAHAGDDYAAFIAWLDTGLNVYLLGAFIIVGCYHGALGVQEIIEDYVSTQRAAYAAIFAVKTAFLALAVLCIGSLILIVMK